MKSIGSISWPTDRGAAVKILQQYMLNVVNNINIDFNEAGNSPILVLQRLIDGEASEDDRISALDFWWNLVGELGIRNFSEEKALVARLAISLLTPNEGDDLDLGEQLSWFIELLGFLNADVESAINIMRDSFDFSEE